MTKEFHLVGAVPHEVGAQPRFLHLIQREQIQMLGNCARLQPGFRGAEDLLRHFIGSLQLRI
ncbi:hypothetical protein D3C72_2231380 [compost metagenome]